MIEYLLGLPECGLWCNGMWGFREYAFIVIPIILVISMTIYATYTNETAENIVLAAFIGLTLGGMFVMIFIILPIIGAILLVLCVLVCGSYLAGKALRELI